VEEERLISKDWYYYDHKCVVFRPKNMSPEELQEGYRHVMKSFYSISGMAGHFAWSLRMTPVIPKRILFFLLWNFVHRAFVREIDRVPALAPDAMPSHNRLQSAIHLATTGSS
jgi:hypothetical protein